MLRISLSEHHQLNIAGITAKPLKSLSQVFDLIFSESQAKLKICLRQSVRPSAKYIHLDKRLRRRTLEKGFQFGHGSDYRVYHPIVDQCIKMIFSRAVGHAINAEYRYAFNALDAMETTVPRDIGRFTGPRRYGAKTRANNALPRAVEQPLVDWLRRARVQQRCQPNRVDILSWRQFDHVCVRHLTQPVAFAQLMDLSSQQLKTGFRQG
jgi:hypothetical protein